MASRGRQSSATIWLPDTERFFTDISNLIESAQIQRNTGHCDSSEFYVRRLEEYERTLSILTTRIEESFAQEIHLIEDLYCLLGILNELRCHFGRVLEESERNTIDCFSLNEATPSLVSVTRSGAVGRPRLQIEQEQLRILHGEAGFRWADVARNLGVSERTVRRRRHEFGLVVGRGADFSDISDEDLDSHVRQILTTTPSSGQRLVEGGLRCRGLRIQRRRIQESIRRVDPVICTLRAARHIIRRVYNVPCPNALWHIDGDHKLIQPYRFVIHGGLDGYSRMIVFLHASTNNRASTVFEHFQSAVQKYNLPSRVRSDLGLENIEVAQFMVQSRGLNRGSHITGKSVHNQRIERLWRDVNRVIASRFLNIFLFLEQASILDPTNELHLYCLHIVYTQLINEAIDEFIGQWNNHPVSTESNLSPNQLWIQGMLSLRNSGYSAVSSATQGEMWDFNQYGIDDEGPVPDVQQGYGVNVPATNITLTQEQVISLQEARDSVRQSGDDDGILAYEVILEMVQSFVNIV